MRVFLSDLHLEDPASARFNTFATVMREEAKTAEAIYLLGDLTEVWVGDDDDGPLASQLRAVLSDAASECTIHVMRGNRDFLFGTRFASETGVGLIDDPLLLDDDTLVAHGDGFCIDDPEYQKARALFRSEAWRSEILGQTLAERRELARSLRTESRESNANKAENIMDVADREVARVVGAAGAKRLIHGHTHRPGVHTHDWGRRFVLGAWERCGWLARQRRPDTDPQLECFALTYS